MINWVKRLLSKSSTKCDLPSAKAIMPAGVTQPPHTDESVKYKNQGDTYFEQGKLNEAADCYQAAIASNPNYAEAYNNWGNLCRELNLPEEAERHLRKAADLKPELPNVRYNLASLLLARGKLIDAIENFAKEVAREPKHYAALAIMLHLKQKICDWRDLDTIAKVLRKSVFIPVESPEQSFSPFAFIALPGTTRAEQKLCAERWVRTEYQSLIELRSQLAFRHDRPRNQKLSIGYILADFREHPVARLMAEVVELHDRSHFHIAAYSYGPDDSSPIRNRLQNAFDDFIDIQKDSDVNAARRIYADKVDILIDLTGFTENSRSGILALRPAPLQLSYLGYLGTMGADFIDYLIADNFIVPPEHQNDYTEKILSLPNCFQANDRSRPRPPAPPRKFCELPDDAFVFCCFNQSHKITPELLDIWCQLLIDVPKSVLWLFSSTPFSTENLRHEASMRGVSPSRIIIAHKVRLEDSLARLQCADLFLDTIPYNAGTTCSDALWVGLPVITCVSQTFSSRMAGSLLSAIGVPELITKNLKDYYQLARALAFDRNELERVRSKIITNRDCTPLFDTARLTRALENAYFTLYGQLSSLR